jgi:hypothetical protein
MIGDLLLAVSHSDSVAILFFAFFAATFLSRFHQHVKKSADVPGVGYGSLPYISSWQGAIAFTFNPRALIQLGYNKYRSGIFKISTLQREHIIVCDRQKIQEYLSAPDHVLNIEDSLEQNIQGTWTIDYGLWDHLFHISFVRSRLAPNLASRFAGMQNEISSSLDTVIGDPQGKLSPTALTTPTYLLKIGLKQRYIGQWQGQLLG